MSFAAWPRRHSLPFDLYFQFMSLIFGLSTFSFHLTQYPETSIQKPASRNQHPASGVIGLPVWPVWPVGPFAGLTKL
ncbi:hypothetical protein D3OALGA1CA_3271 [Olavius algarvensis associated proteobacterium Delta 3]|nr:hypothetical protein D3OALGA1CA_3271 [Olavius algarvensis associated proteobacterium Delta 3]